MGHYRILGYTFSHTEIKELFLAWALLSLAFGILFTGTLAFSVPFLINFLFAGATVGISFLLHELAHKVVAQRYGCVAEFRAFREMLFLSLLISFTGIIIAAPGAVIISGYVNRIVNGKIASAGPLMNIMLAVLFAGMGFFYGEGVLSPLMDYGLRINALLALFNLIPFSLFDGAKIFEWDRIKWGTLTVLSVLLMIGGEVL